MKKILLILFVGIMLIEFGSADMWPSYLNNGLRSYYSMNDTGTKNDQLGNYPISLSGGTLYTLSGKFGAGYVGDGTNYGTWGTVLESVNSFSISLWFKSSSGNTNQRIIQGGSVSSFIELKPFNCAQTLSSDTSITINQGACTNTGVNLHDNAWHHIVIVSSNATNYSQLYIDNVLKANMSTGGYSGETESIRFGGHTSGTTYSLTANQNVDEVAVWNRTINSSEISILYSAGVGIARGFSSSLSVCNPDYNTPLINFTGVDEMTGAGLNISLNNLYLTDSSGTYNYYNTTEYKNRAFCSYLTNYSDSVFVYAPYTSGTYPQRIFQTTLNLNNITLNKTLYLLSASSGQYVTFQLINAAEQPLEDVFVVINKSISGVQTQISSGYTGADGGVTFWLNPDNQYTISAYLSPYPVYSATQAFTQDSYTITLGINSNINVSDYNKGMSYSFNPTDEWLSNGTIYNFNLTLTSSYWALQEYGFNVTNESGTYLGQSNDTSPTGGVTSLDLNTGLNKTIKITYYWKVNNVTTQFIRIYKVLDFSQNQYSITRLLSDFVSYSASGLFGLTEFGEGLIIFFIIVGVVGIARVKFGMSDEASLAGLLFSLVALFDVGFGLIPNPVGAISYFPTIVIAILFIGFAVKEMRA